MYISIIKTTIFRLALNTMTLQVTPVNVNSLYIIYRIYHIYNIYIYRLALNTMTLQVTSVNVNSGQGVAISVTGIAQVTGQS